MIINGAKSERKLDLPIGLEPCQSRRLYARNHFQIKMAKNDLSNKANFIAINTIHLFYFILKFSACKKKHPLPLLYTRSRKIFKTKYYYIFIVRYYLKYNVLINKKFGNIAR